MNNEQACGDDSNLHVHIDKEDCVLIFKGDGTLEYLIPPGDDPEEFMPNHCVVATMFAAAASDPEICSQVRDLVMAKQ
jgi:hypothetical protein